MKLSISLLRLLISELTSLGLVAKHDGRSKVNPSSRATLSFTQVYFVPEMAGNIIPAISTTNAIVAGLLVLQAINMLKTLWKSQTFPKINLPPDSLVFSSPVKSIPAKDTMQEVRLIWWAKAPEKGTTSQTVLAPKINCSVCRSVYLPIKVSPKLTIKQFLDRVVKERLEGLEDCEMVIMEGSRLILDPDFTDNEEKTFEDLDLKGGKMLNVWDEDGDRVPIVFILEESV
jgi:ubiquitin-like 1-activating enzyme E1 B